MKQNLNLIKNKLNKNKNMNRKNKKNMSKKQKKYLNRLMIVYQLIMLNKLHKKHYIKQVLNINHKNILENQI